MITFLKNWFHSRNRPPKYIFLILIIFGCAYWHITQHFIQAKGAPKCGIEDLLHDWTLWFNLFCQAHPKFANAILIVSTFWIDFSALFIFGRSLWVGGSRPLVSLGLFFLFRQILQFMVSLPMPPNIIWHEPGFPALLVTYKVSNDLYFSSHTGMALLAAIEFKRMGNRFFEFLANFMFFFELWTVIALQIHYTMDVYTAIITVFLVSWIANRCSSNVDAFLCRLDSWIRK